MREQEHIDGRGEAVLDYLDGTLSEERSREIARHLSGCSRCREAVAEQRRAIAILATVQSAEPPPELEERVLGGLGGLAHRRLGQMETPARGQDTGRRRTSLFGSLPPWLRPSTLLPAATLLIFVGVGLVWFTQSEQTDDLRTFQADAPAGEQDSTDREAAATAEDSSQSSAGDEAAGVTAAEPRDGAAEGEAPEEDRALGAAEQSPMAAPGEVLNLRLSTGTSPERAAQIFESITTLRALPSQTVTGGIYLVRMLPEDLPLLVEFLSEAGLEVASTVTSSTDLPPALSRAVDDTLLLRPQAGGQGFVTQPLSENGAAPEDTVLVVALTG